MSDAQFEEDAALVAADLARLKALVEQGVAEAMRARAADDAAAQGAGPPGEAS